MSWILYDELNRWCRLMISLLVSEPSAPEDVIVKLVSPRSVELTWTPPAHKNGVIVSYVIHYAGKQASMSAVSWDVKTEKGSMHALRCLSKHENMWIIIFVDL